MPRSSASKKSVAAGERDRPDVARRRLQWTKYQDRLEADRLVFIDETWTRTDMAPLRGWALRGHRLPAKVPHGRWKTMTFLAALRHDRIDAPWFFEGPIDGESFRTYVAKVLLPTFRPGNADTELTTRSNPWATTGRSNGKEHPIIKSSPIGCLFRRLSGAPNTKPCRISLQAGFLVPAS